MKKVLILSVALLSALASCGNKAGAVKAPKTSADSLSVALGAALGNQLKSGGFGDDEYDLSTVLATIEATLDGQEILTIEQVQAVFSNYFTVIKPSKQKVANESFLSDAEAKSGAQKTASGLVYVVEEAGDAALKPQIGDTIKVHYNGTLPNGDKFDSSYDRGEPIEFPLENGGLIAGWIEGVQLIGKGGKVTLYVPSELAYGQQGTPGGPIGPNQPLQFEIELLDVISAK